jgi:hypothetical protein
MKKDTQDLRRRTLEELLPPGLLSTKWSELLNAKRNEPDAAQRELQFQYAHGWLKALVDVGVLSHADMPELRELLIAPKPENDMEGAEKAWKKSVMISFYHETASEQSNCEVVLTGSRISVTYLFGPDDDEYEYIGEDNGGGHFVLKMKAHGSEGHAILHRMPDSDFLDGYWEEDRIKGMWRIKLVA